MVYSSLSSVIALIFVLEVCAKDEQKSDCSSGFPHWATVLITAVCTAIICGIIALIIWYFRVKRKLKWMVFRRFCANFWICRRCFGYLKRKYADEIAAKNAEIKKLKKENDELKKKLEEAKRELHKFRPKSPPPPTASPTPKTDDAKAKEADEKPKQFGLVNAATSTSSDDGVPVI
ncbi:hypothetical protein M3Y94_00037100 [Aphelenchoides besseyi]|nr:hypothetical protein M3Y94_00037100 [Aphelenchoides besseyi]KAI6219061.1 hypothetical protein M3Y95_01126900 [Aphelenchoides besseyi]